MNSLQGSLGMLMSWQGGSPVSCKDSVRLLQTAGLLSHLAEALDICGQSVKSRHQAD